MQYEDENGVNEPSRRRLLKGIGALALAGSCPVTHAQKPQSAPGTLSPDARNEKQPFYGEHQAGILTPQQAAMMLVAFDVLASDKADLERLFRLLTQRFAFLTQGGAAPETPNPRLPPLDSGILGGYIAPDNLTITLSVGHSLFDERFGLASQMPKKLQKMTRFPNDSLDATLCHGDVLLQICANTQDTVIHALRDIIKHTPDLLSVRWKREGFISEHAARSKGKETPLKEQQTIFGRDKQTGAPLGMQHEHDVPDYASDPEGKVIALDSHIRLANPRTPESESSLMLRRGYSYSLGVTNSGQLDMGLLFVCYQHDLEKGFLTVQKRLNGEALEEYVKPIGGGYFFALPGVKDTDDYLGRTLLQV
ncbi:Dyp-type peroxidase [Escherichia albertii]|nr:Dyp-type peroxidase [Escherichia albertii]